MRSCVLLCALACACIPDLTLPPRPPDVDRNPPAFSDFAATPAFARDGVLVVFTFSTNKPIDHDGRAPSPNPEVTFAETLMTCDTGETQHRCELLASPALGAEGPRNFTLLAQDRGGNISKRETPNLTVTLDFTPPTLTVVESPDPAQRGAQMTFDITASEDLAQLPSLQARAADGSNPFANNPACAGAVPGKTFSCTAVPSIFQMNGNVDYAVTGLDLAGNPSPMATGAFTLIDPVMGSVSLSNIGVLPAVVRPTASTTIVFQASATLTGCEARIQQTGTLATCNPGGSICTCTLVAPPVDLAATLVLVGYTAGGTGSANAVLEIDNEVPVLTSSLFQLTRQPVGTADVLAATEGAVDDPNGHRYDAGRATRISVWPALDAGVALLDIDLFDGGFAATPIAGTAATSTRTFFASAFDVANNESARVALPGADLAPPFTDGGGFTLVRNPPGFPDGVMASAGAVSDLLSDVAGVRLTTVADGGGLLLLVTPVNGGFSEQPIGDPDASYARLWAAGVDKAGNVSVPVHIDRGADLLAPVVDGGSIIIVRRDLSSIDSIWADAGAFTDDGTIIRVHLFDAFDAGMQFATLVPNARGGFAELPVGTTSSTPCQIWAVAVDKTGKRSARFEALIGRDVAPPDIDAGAFTFTRRPIGQVDGVSAGVGAVSDATSFVHHVTFFVSAQPLDASTPLPNGSLTEVAIGDVNASVTTLRASATDKCGRTTSPSVVLPNADTTDPAIDPALISIIRRPMGANDGALGLAGSVTDTQSAIRTIDVYTQASNGTAIPATVTAGGFSEVSIGTPSSSFQRVWVVARDKAGNTVSPRVMQTGPGVDVAGPVIHSSFGRHTRRPADQLTTLWADAGTVTDAVSAIASVQLVGGDGGFITLDAVGGFDEFPIDPFAQTVKIYAVDKVGNYGDGGRFPVSMTMTLSGRVPYDATATNPSQIALFGGDSRTLSGVVERFPELSTADELAASAVGGAVATTTVAPVLTMPVDKWTQLAIPGPGPRKEHTAVYDPRYGRVLLFGGEGPGGTLLGDTWALVGSTWTSLVTTGTPSPRKRAGMVYDPHTGKVMLVGGEDTMGARSDVWELDGTTWTQSAFSPPVALAGHTLFWQPAGTAGVICSVGGGATGGTVCYSQSSHWAISVTHDRTNTGYSVVHPTATSNDAVDLTGGLQPDGGISVEHFDRSGGAWNARADMPSARHGMMGTVDPYNDAFLFGGKSASGVVDEMDRQFLSTTNFSAFDAGTVPPARAYGTWNGDPARRASVLFGGEGASGAPLGDTWTFTGGWQFPRTVRAAQVFMVRPPNVTIGGSPTVTWVGHATGNDGGVAIAGARLEQVNGTVTSLIGNHVAQAGDPAVARTITATFNPVTSFSNGYWWFVASSTYPVSAPGAASTVNASVSTDYFELKFSY